VTIRKKGSWGKTMSLTWSCSIDQFAEDAAYLRHYLLRDKGVAMALRSRFKAIKSSLRSGLPLASPSKEVRACQICTVILSNVKIMVEAVIMI
jgi:hypothetical protein